MIYLLLNHRLFLRLKKKVQSSNPLKLFFSSFTISTWFNIIVRLGGNIVISILVLKYSSVEVVTVWLLITSLVNFINMSDFGFSAVLSRHYSYNVTDIKTKNIKYNWGSIQTLYQMSGIFYVIASVLFLIICYVLYSTSITTNIQKIDNPNPFYIAYLVYVIGSTFILYGKKYYNALIGLGKVPLVNFVNGSVNLVFCIISIFFFIKSKSILQLAIPLQIGKIIIVILNWYLLKNIRHKNVIDRSPSWDKQMFKEMFSPTWRGALGFFGSVGIVEISGHYYSLFGEPSSVASYLFSIKLVYLISLIANVPFYSKLPIWNSLRKQNKINLLANKVFVSINIVLALYTLGIMVVGYSFPFFLKLVNSQTTILPLNVWFIVGIVYFLERHHGMHAHIYSTTNNEPFYLPIIFTGVIYITLLYLFKEDITPLIIILSYGISNLIINNWWNVSISIKSLQFSYINYFTKIKISVLFFFILIANYLLSK